MTELTLEPLLNDEFGVHTGSKLIFSMSRAPEIRFSLSIEATILRCTVLSAGFAVSSYALKYNIGTRDYQYKFPDIIQEPACNQVIEWYTYTAEGTLSQSTISQMIDLDAESQSISIETDDFSLLGLSFVLKIKAFSSQYENVDVKSFTLVMTLTTTGPEFIYAPTADDLSCNSSAADWEMELPEIKNDD